MPAGLGRKPHILGFRAHNSQASGEADTHDVLAGLWAAAVPACLLETGLLQALDTNTACSMPLPARNVQEVAPALSPEEERESASQHFKGAVASEGSYGQKFGHYSELAKSSQRSLPVRLAVLMLGCMLVLCFMLLSHRALPARLGLSPPGYAISSGPVCYWIDRLAGWSEQAMSVPDTIASRVGPVWAQLSRDMLSAV